MRGRRPFFLLVSMETGLYYAMYAMQAHALSGHKTYRQLIKSKKDLRRRHIVKWLRKRANARRIFDAIKRTTGAGE